MPDNTYPPPASDVGAVIVPRQLLRWLDRHSQGGAMMRTMTTITVPAFTTTHVYDDHPDITRAFNFEADNNFTLKAITQPSDVNYALVISWLEDDLLHSYLLWDSTVTGYTATMAQRLPAYTGQLIKKNFRLEIWNTATELAEQAIPLTLYTSVRGNLDYRFGTDAALSEVESTISDFWTTLPITLPGTFPAGSNPTTN